jgi:predicted transcriptional regulator
MLIDYVLELMSDGKWHDTDSLARKLNCSRQGISEILEFCAEFGFVSLNRSREKARMDEKFRRLVGQLSDPDWLSSLC